MAGELSVLMGGKVIEVRLGENTAEAKRQADKAAGIKADTLQAADEATLQAGRAKGFAEQASVAQSSFTVFGAQYTSKFAPDINIGDPVFEVCDSQSFTGFALSSQGVFLSKAFLGQSFLVEKSMTVATGAQILLEPNASLKSTGGDQVGFANNNYDWSVSDGAGNPALAVKSGAVLIGPISASGTQKAGEIAFPNNQGYLRYGNYNYDFCIDDDNGNCLLGVLDGKFYSPLASSAPSILDVADADNKAFTAALHRTRVTRVQKPNLKYDLLIMYGQSLGQGDETWPALSRDNLAGTYMLGGNTLSSADGGAFVQFAPTGFQPLVAMTVYGSTTYPDETVTQASGGARGEPANIGWARGARVHLDDYLLLEDPNDKSLVTINVAKSGATIGELEKGHTEGGTEYYDKYAGALTQAVAASGASSIAVTGLMYMQGEHDYLQATGHNSLNRTYADYKAKLQNLAANMQADAISATGQTRPPAFLLYQTGASYTRDQDANGVPGMHVGMAQLDFSLENENAWMVGPIHPYTDKGGHLDSNGSRWFGHQISKVWRQVVIEGREWQPLRPLNVWQDNPGSNVVYVSYHVPFPPLVFDEPQLAGGLEYDSATKGFRLSDELGNFSVTNAEIVKDTIIKLTCARNVGANCLVWYASQGTTGNGMVRDSDPALASDTYVYEPERGMYTTANLPQFVGKKYPLHNWSVGFVISLD